MNRLAPHNAAPRTDKVQHLLDHLSDRCDGEPTLLDENGNPELDEYGNPIRTEYGTLLDWLADPSFGDKTIADIVTREICRPDNLGYTIGPVAVRNHRETM